MVAFDFHYIYIFWNVLGTCLEFYVFDFLLLCSYESTPQPILRRCGVRGGWCFRLRCALTISPRSPLHIWHAYLCTNSSSSSSSTFSRSLQVLEEQKINKARRKWQKQTEFLCNIKFRNSLPDPPLGPHFLEVPLDLDRYVKYTPTTLESNYKWKVRRYLLSSPLFCFLRGCCVRVCT